MNNNFLSHWKPLSCPIYPRINEPCLGIQKKILTIIKRDLNKTIKYNEYSKRKIDQTFERFMNTF